MSGFPNRHSRTGTSSSNAVVGDGNPQALITEHLDIWTSAIKTKSAAGRGSSKKLDLVGIKKLRELVLELAVRGKLVPQDPNDEPASELVQRVNRFLCDEINETKLPKLKRDMSLIPPEEFHYHLPANWVWTELQDIFLFTNGKAHEQYITEDDRYVLVNSKFVSNSGEIRKFVTDRLTPLEKGDFAIVMSDVPNGRALARCYLIETDGKYTLNQRIGGLSTSKEFNKNYLLHLLNRHPYMLGYNDGKKQTNLKKIQIMSAPLAIPPLAEQHRIVAKVDELMALCDQLETQTENSIQAHQLLVETLLATLTNAKDADELNDNWQTISQHFDVLFTTQASIDQLKQTILQLAVMGKLVKQDPNDEPASKLLERIATVKQQLIKDGKIKKQKPLPPITDEEMPFGLQDGWEWSRLGVIGTLKGGFAYQSSKFIESSEHQVIRMGNIRPDLLRIAEKTVFIDANYASSTGEYLLEVNDILLTMTGTKNKRDYLYSVSIKPEHLNDRQLYINQRLCALKAPRVNVEFLSLCLKNDILLDPIFAKSTGTANQANIGMEALLNWVIPMAPSEEQNRIVAKVDELMALCDSLKTRLNEAQTTQFQLTDAIVESSL